MENAEEILQSLDEFSKMKPKDIPRELEEYLCFVAKTGDPVYQWPLIKCLFREKLINVITDFYESCSSVDIPPCPNVAAFNYDGMKNFILEKLDTFAAAPFTVQRICELLTTPRKEYNRIDKYMRALEKNILVVSTREPGNRKSTENGENVVNGLESDHVSQDIINSDINVEVEMDESSTWQKTETSVPYAVNETNIILEPQTVQASETVQDTYISESKASDTAACSSSISTVITSRPISYIGYTPNITDLIIEPSSMAADSEPGPAPTENGDSAPDNANISLFTVGSEPALPTDATTAAAATDDDDDLKEGRVAYAKSADQVESVFVKADCSDAAFVRLERDESQVEAELLAKKDVLLVDGAASEAETSEASIEPEPSVARVDQQDAHDSERVGVVASPDGTGDETSTSSSSAGEVAPAQLSTPAAATVDEPQPSVAQVEPESTFECAAVDTTITSTDEIASVAPAPAAPAETSGDSVQTSCDDHVSESHLSSSELAVAQPEVPTNQNTMEVDEDAVPNTTEADTPAMDTN